MAHDVESIRFQVRYRHSGHENRYHFRYSSCLKYIQERNLHGGAGLKLKYSLSGFNRWGLLGVPTLRGKLSPRLLPAMII